MTAVAATASVLPDWSDVEAANARLAGHALRTPVLRSPEMDALGCQQHGALELARLALGQQGGAQGLAVFEGDEFVSGNIDDLHVLPRRFWGAWVTR